MEIQCQTRYHTEMQVDTTIPIEKVLEITDDTPMGYSTELDISLPENIHELVIKRFITIYIPLPKNITPQTEWFSYYQIEVMMKPTSKSKSQTSVNQLFEHKNNVLHNRLLQVVFKFRC